MASVAHPWWEHENLFLLNFFASCEDHQPLVRSYSQPTVYSLVYSLQPARPPFLRATGRARP
jgi:hypothetical protein